MNTIVLTTVAVVALVGAAIAAATVTETCFFKSEHTEGGPNRICYYDCPSSGTFAFTIKSSQLCPLTIKR